VVATFVTQSEDSGSIAEAVQMISSWNPEWMPQSFMVDFCEAEINTLGSVFPGTHVNRGAQFSATVDGSHEGDQRHRSSTGRQA